MLISVDTADTPDNSGIARESSRPPRGRTLTWLPCRTCLQVTQSTSHSLLSTKHYWTKCQKLKLKFYTPQHVSLSLILLSHPKASCQYSKVCYEDTNLGRQSVIFPSITQSLQLPICLQIVLVFASELEEKTTRRTTLNISIFIHSWRSIFISDLIRIIFILILIRKIIPRM